ncbi:MAG: hypothetical protein KTR32_31280 [Granulosicoccus sp.]|nr:hypothetical protein [Granulosicoccus sp.]
MKYVAKSFIGATLLALPLSLVFAEGKIVTVVLSEEPDIIDPCEASRSNIGRVVKQNIAETLIEIDPADGSIKPRLATAWQQVDELTWNFTLREGIKFHDGADFNAETAVASINRTLNPTQDCEIRLKFFGNISVMPKALDATTLEIKTDTPQPILPTLMGTMVIASPNTQAEKGTMNPVGTGPYKFVKWDAGQEIVLERFDGYWGDQPEAEGARFIWRTESAVRAAMIKTGEADIAPNIALQDATDGTTDFSYFNSETSRLRIDMTRPPLDDIRIRKAMNYAIDRDALTGSLFSADVVPMTQIVVPSINGHNTSLKPWPYDPAKARELIAAAKADGVPVDDEIVVLGRIGMYPNATEVAEAMQAMLSDVGFNAKLSMIEVAEWIDIFTKPYAEDRGPVLQASQHDNNNGDAVFSVFFKYACEGPQSTMCDEEVDAGITAASAAVGDERREIWQQVFKRLHEEIVPDVQMFHMVGFSRVNPRINFTPSISTNSEVQIAQVTFK